MEFSIKSESYNYEGSLYECIAFLQTKYVLLAEFAEETGLHFSMMRLNLNNPMIVEDDIGREVTITRIK
ncbi:MULTISPECIES: hypothetical protein [Lysinibacillus]|uniref:hypothetical protein n=1 Tax=Lysinibacillus TaxID=400634 RepID=UPI00214B21DC|nr:MULTISPECIES: hypothetical protein [Lysinibacillus]UUV25935.1 hypothetical protein NP781_04765 [Lysinibacillus sp. FN11]UYB48808.1 hypothetical protein OCI51_07555 [Lysinibacillus capsici]